MTRLLTLAEFALVLFWLVVAVLALYGVTP